MMYGERKQFVFCIPDINEKQFVFCIPDINVKSVYKRYKIKRQVSCLHERRTGLVVQRADILPSLSTTLGFHTIACTLLLIPSR